MVQVAYREAGGFPLLLQLIDGCMTPRDAEPQQPDLSIPAAAVDALSTLARNNAGNRSAYDLTAPWKLWPWIPLQLRKPADSALCQ